MRVHHHTREAILNILYGLAVLLLTMPIMLVFVLPFTLSATLIIAGIVAALAAGLTDRYLRARD